MDRHTHHRLVEAWNFGILGFILSCVFDFDHIPEWIFQMSVDGRMFHTVEAISLFSICFTLGSCAYALRRRIVDRVSLCRISGSCIDCVRCGDIESLGLVGLQARTTEAFDLNTSLL